MRTIIIPSILFFISILCVLNLQGQTKIKENYLQNMPTVEKLLQNVQGSDDLDTKARQSAACEMLYDFIVTIANQKPKAKNQGTNLWLTNEEKKLNGMYSGTSTKIIVQVNDELDPYKKDRFKAGSSCDDWRHKRESYLEDNEFAGSLLKQYISAELTQLYLDLKKKRRDEYQASPEYKAEQKEYERSLKISERERRSNIVVKEFQMKKYAMIGLAAIVLLILLPWFNYFRNKSMELTQDKLISSRREYGIYSVTGVIADASKTSTTHVYTTGGSYNSSTGTYSSPTVHSSSTIHDQLFLIDKNGCEHPVQLSGWNLAVRPGNTLTMLWAIKKGEKDGPYLMAINHTTNLKYSMTHILRKMFNPGWTWLFTLVFVVLVAMYSFVVEPYWSFKVNNFGTDRIKIDDKVISIALYFQVYCWTWGLYIVGLIVNKAVKGRVANKKTEQFIDYFKVSDFK